MQIIYRIRHRPHLKITGIAGTGIQMTDVQRPPQFLTNHGRRGFLGRLDQKWHRIFRRMMQQSCLICCCL